ncbi:MAG: hypothetical protein JWN22_308 [Nocardioides sp.]|jgi:hypothetical protein|nr:hypothetical protein [Nocardioides sp.]
MHSLPRTRLVALAAAAVAASLLAGCSPDDSTAADPNPAGSSPKKTPKNQPTEEASEPSGTSTGSSAQVTVPVYFVGDTPQGPRLYREFRKVEAGNPLEEAAALLTAGDALDPDYQSLLPDIEFTDVSYQSDPELIVVSVASDEWSERPADMTEAEASLAVQQLVYTLQGVAQARAPMLVTVGAEGDNVPLLGVPTQNPTKNAPQLDVSALVNLTTPEQGASVGDTFTASGVASSFEATVPWEIRRGDTVVKKGFTTAEGWMDKLYPFEAKVDVSDLAPGEYTFVAMTDDPSDGEGGGPTEDSKTITVR